MLCTVVETITLIGNCQAKALCWFIRQLNDSFDVKYICPEYFTKWPFFSSNCLYDKPINTITDTDSGINRLKTSSCVIYQILDRGISEHFRQKNIQQYATEATLISISSFHWHPKHPEFLDGMINRMNKFKIDIPAPSLIEKHPGLIKLGPIRDTGYRAMNNEAYSKLSESEAIKTHSRHPNAFYFLELVREICNHAGWEFYSDELYSELLDHGFPFG